MTTTRTYEYGLSLEDLVAFALHHERSSPLRRRRRRVLHLGLAFLLAAVVTAVCGLARAPAWFWLFGYAVVVFYFLRFPGRYEKGLRRNVEQAYREGRNLGLLGPHRLTVDPEAITEATALREVRTRWAAVEQVVEAKDHLFVYVSGSTAFVVPRSAFGQPEEASRFVAQVREAIAHAADPAS
jgi:hypothetical protein